MKIYIFLTVFLLSSKLFSIVEEGGVIITFDDGYVCQYEHAAPLLEKYGYTATFYVTTGLLGKDGYMTSDQIVSLKQRGHDIGSHAVTHLRLSRLHDLKIEQELVRSKEYLEALLQIPIVHFAPPFGACNPTVLMHVKNQYKSQRTIGRGWNDPERGNPYLIRVQLVFCDTSFEEWLGWVNVALEERKWLVLVYHCLDATESLTSITPEKFEDHLRYLNDHRVPVGTMTDFLELLHRR